MHAQQRQSHNLRQEIQNNHSRTDSADRIREQALALLACGARQSAQRAAGCAQICPAPHRSESAETQKLPLGGHDVAGPAELLDRSADRPFDPQQALQTIRTYQKSHGAQSMDLADALRQAERQKTGNAPHANANGDAPKPDLQTQSDLLSKTADVPIQTNQSLKKMRVRARAAEGKRIEVADDRDRHDPDLIAHEKRHIVQQQMTEFAPDAPQIDASQAEIEANANDGKLSPCHIESLFQESNICQDRQTDNLTQDEIQKAIEENAKLNLRTDFIIRLKAKLGLHVARSTPNGINDAIAIDESLISAIADFQNDCVLGMSFDAASRIKYAGMNNRGIIDEQTWLAIEDFLFGEDGYKSVIGRHAKGGTPIVSGVNAVTSANPSHPVSEQTYLRCREIIENWGEKQPQDKDAQPAGGYFDERVGYKNLLAVRSAKIVGDKIIKADDLEDPCRFWSSEKNIGKCKTHKYRKPYNDIMLMIWKTIDASGKPEYYADAYAASVDPGSPRCADASACKSQTHPNGTAHLRDGQYIYKLGQHGTTASDHIKAVLDQVCKNGRPQKKALPNETDIELVFNPEVQENAQYHEFANAIMKNEDFVFSLFMFSRIDLSKSEAFYSFEKDGTAVTDRLKFYKIRYPALIKTRPTEVYREESRNASGALTLKDVGQSRKHIAGNRREFRDIRSDIMINIHSGTPRKTSSQGCQNIQPNRYFDFLKKATDIDDAGTIGAPKQVLYTIIDASKIAVPQSCSEIL